DPFGRDVSNALGFDDRTFSTELAGGHFLLIEGRVSDTVTERAYRFALDRPVDPAPAALTLGATTTVTIVRPTEQTQLEFTVTERTRDHFDSLTGNSHMLWDLSGVTGSLASGNFYYSDSHEATSDRAIDLPPGAYALTISGNGFTTGDATFRLLDLSEGTTITMRQPVSGELDPVNQTDVYTFNATAGQRYFFRSLQVPSRASVRILAPDGKQIANPYSYGDIEFTAGKAGAYTILVEGRVWDTATSRAYGFTLHDSATTIQ